MSTKYLLYLLLFLIIFGLVLSVMMQKKETSPLWSVRSVDTVKYSRDLAKEKGNSEGFKSVIEKQVKDIASTGANYVAIGTPYDEEFLPFMMLWVQAARENDLNVWFRGNFSGWEGWFEYPLISKEEHKQKLEKFIINNPQLFEDGDIFTPCPECENGVIGDPRLTRDVEGFRQFLIDEYNISSHSFAKINKKVTSGYFSSNYDVAKLIMDKQTTQKLGGVVVIDHYVKDPYQIAEDVSKIQKSSTGKVVLGELGVPIPDIHGTMDDQQQSEWLDKALSKIAQKDEVLGINYWVGVGGSTQIWTSDGNPKQAVKVLRKYFNLEIPLD